MSDPASDFLRRAAERSIRVPGCLGRDLALFAAGREMPGVAAAAGWQRPVGPAFGRDELWRLMLCRVATTPAEAAQVARRFGLDAGRLVDLLREAFEA